MSRRDSREVAVKIIFQYDFGGISSESSLDDIIAKERLELCMESCDKSDKESLEQEYVTDIVSGILTNKTEIDSLINKHAKGWTIERMAKLDVAVLRVAVYEMRYRDDIPQSVSINEAVDIAKKYGHEDSGSFVNGILGSVYADK